MSLDGQLLERGFWLYVCRVTSPAGAYLYVGRTGDSSSPKASSPFERFARHLDLGPNAKASALAKRLREVGIRPSKCRFDVIAMGPVFPEQVSMRTHVPFRDRAGALEGALAVFLRDRGYEVLGRHSSGGGAEPRLLSALRAVLDREFPLRTIA